MADPTLSVVVPTKGRPGYLHRCLAALAAATYPGDRYEVVVVNDAGGPAVERVVSSFAERLPIRLAEPRGRGPAAARNAGAAAARGRYIAFTDDDCEPAPGWLCALERALELNAGAAVGGETRNGAPQSRAAASQIVVDAVHEHFNRNPGAPRFFASSNVAFPARLFVALGGFNERFRHAEDREICERWIASGHRLVREPKACVYHMRRFTLRGFIGQHYGYGRGASAFHRSRAPERQRESDRAGVLRELARKSLHQTGKRGSAATAVYVAVAQLATAAGYVRETVAARLSPTG